MQESNLDIQASAQEAWKLTYGAKWAIWAPMLVAFLSGVLLFGGLLILSLVYDNLPHNKILTALIFALGIVLVVAFIYVFIGLVSGAIKTSIERAKNNPITSKTGFHSFDKVNTVLLTFLCFVPFMIPQFIINLITQHNAFLFRTQILQIIYSILIGPFLFIALPIAVDKTDSALEAIKTSVKKGLEHWKPLAILSAFIQITMFLITLLLRIGGESRIGGLSFIGGIIFILAYIWFLPFMSILQGVIYRKLTKN